MRDAIDPTGEIHTPYGATEALPVASISARQILAETAERTQSGAGYCVGRRFPGIQWKVIPISDQPLTAFKETEELERGQIGELVVRGEVVTSEYATRQEANAWHKIHAADGTWHRMGDVGYLDDQDRFWFCGRKSHRLQTARGVMFTIPCEAIFNCHPAVYRSALVGVGTPGQQRPAVVVEPWPECWPRRRTEQERLRRELRETAAQNALTREIEDIFLKRQLPVDIRHNAKIFREQLAVWVARRTPRRAGSETS
jgi:acyl-CoA synthetase (AMP-forming)/AMP-acid ligase II